MATATVENHEDVSTVSVKITGWGVFTFQMEKFPSHCGATIMHNMSLMPIARPTIAEQTAYKELTKWLVSTRREEQNFKRARIIAADHIKGPIAKMAHYCDEWNHSNPVVNWQTNREIAFYWLDR